MTTSIPRKVCIVAGVFPARSETFVVEHVCGLACRGYEVTVFSQGPAEGV